MDFTVIGDSVNLVSRIEAMNKQYGTSILMSEETYAQVREVVVGDMVAEAEVRGRVKTVRLYSITSSGAVGEERAAPGPGAGSSGEA